MPDPAPIRLLVLDVDGVLTDGRIVIDDLGRESKFFHVRDGLGMRLWMKVGGEIAIVTGRSSRVVAHRAAELEIRHVFQGALDKRAALQKVWERTGLSAAQTAALADDLPDLPILRSVGYPVAVADAAAEVKAAAAFLTTLPGGRGAVREAVEHLLRAQNRWDEACRHFREKH